MSTRDHEGIDQLPDILRPLFWDHDFEDMSWEEHRSFVIHRVMRAACPPGAVPSPRALEWLCEHVSAEELLEQLVERRGRGFAGEELRWWGRELRVPDELVEEWLGAPERQAWDYLR